MAELKTTLRVFNEADLKWEEGIVPRQKTKLLVGNSERVSERLRVILASFTSGSPGPLHWHLIEAFYYVISGRAVMTDIEGKRYDLGPGSVVYAPAGIAGSHEWHIQEPLQLISVRATTDLEKNIQFTVDKSTKESSIEGDLLIKRG